MKKNVNKTEKGSRAWVVFCKDTDIWWLKFLRPGFRHCFLILNDGYNWITYDPMSAFTEITVQKTPIEFNLPKWFSERGDIVVLTDIIRKRKIAPASIYTCVESVKRVLGLHKPWVLTPYQLYNFLNRKDLPNGNIKL